ncbi:unnamed protein product [Caenorhabditis brenneri]
MDPPAGNGVLITPASQFTLEHPLLLKLVVCPCDKKVTDVIPLNCAEINSHLPLERVSHALNITKMFPVEHNVSLADLIKREPVTIDTFDRRQKDDFMNSVCAIQSWQRDSCRNKIKKQDLHLRTVQAKLREITRTISQSKKEMKVCKKAISKASENVELAETAAMEAEAALLSIKVDCFASRGIEVWEIHQTLAITNETNHGQFIESFLKWREANDNKVKKNTDLNMLLDEEKILQKSLEEHIAEEGRMKLVVEEETKKLMELNKSWEQFEIERAVLEPLQPLRGPTLRKIRQQRQQQRQQAPIQQRQRQPRQRQRRQP